MMTGIEINKYIKNWLHGDAVLQQKVGVQNMKPLVLSPTSYPFISWTHDEIIPEYTKDGCIVDHVDEIIAIVSNDYEEAVEIAAEVRKLLEYQKFENSDVYIPTITVSSVTEDMYKDAYLLQIVFSFDLHSK